MKKFFTLVLAAMMLFAFVACDSKTPAPAPVKKPASEYSTSATLSSEWAIDRTEPKSFTVEDGAITIETTTANLDLTDFNRYQGKSSKVTMDLASSWKVSATLNVTEELLASGTDNGAVSIWLQVMSSENEEIDWTIVELLTGKDAKYHFWKESNGKGEFLDLEINLPPTVGEHEITLEFNEGTIFEKIDGTQIAQYNLTDNDGKLYTESTIEVVIIQSLNNGSSYSASWSVPKVEYNPVEPAESAE